MLTACGRVLTGQLLYNSAFMASFLNLTYLQIRSSAISLIHYKPFKGGLPYLLSQKMAAEFVV